MARFIQISDPHVVVPPGLASGRLETARLLEETVAHIRAHLPKIAPVDGLLVTGDISHDEGAESYTLFQAIVAPLGLPVHVIPGNHDLREPMRASFAGMPKTGRLNWTRDVSGVRLIGLDTLVEGQGGGILDDATLSFLRAALANAQGRPVLLMIHHPPFASGIRFMDAIGLNGVAGLADILQDFGGEIRILCGHVHAMMVGAVGGAVALACPATCSMFDPDFRADAPVGFMTAPEGQPAGGFIVHDWDAGFRSILIAPGGGCGPYPF